jgi:DNA-directed RNA polymerase specialized sigma24 family protein
VRVVDEFEEFVRARSVALMKYGHALAGNPHDGADLVQEALVRLGLRWSSVRSKGDVEPWVRTVRGAAARQLVAPATTGAPRPPPTL